MSFGYQVLGFGTVGSSPVFYAATGGTVTTDGDFKVHTFSSAGTFQVTEVGSDALDYIIVAGGGAGGKRVDESGAGGGGAGGMLVGTSTPSANNYSVVIGAGGDGSSGGAPVQIHLCFH